MLEIAPYVPGKARAAGFERPIKLSANENALGCSASARAAYLEAAARLNLYPDPRATLLREAIADRFTLEPERLIFGCGSDELFSLVCNAYLAPGDNAVQPEFGFAAWAIAARAAGAAVKDAPERALTVDVDALLAEVDDRTRLVFLANPANPTGTMIPFEDVRRLHAALPAEVVLVLDGAYAEYAAHLAGFDDGLELARRAANVLVTRTFSKIHGLAGLRIGWGYGGPGLIEAMDRIRPPFNAAAPAQAAAVAALADAAHVAASVAHVERLRPEIAAALERAGVAPVPSATNFVTFHVPPQCGLKAAELAAALAARGVLVRELKGYGLPDALRVTIGLDEEVSAFLEGLRAALAGGMSAPRGGDMVGAEMGRG
ncbi:MAG TPA: histidinol-phosphate transaminase [Caulobacteraceae bacterium]